MSSSEASARCGECGAELKESDKLCPKCISDKVIFNKSVGGHTLHPKGRLRVRKKQEGFSKFVVEVVKGWFPSRNPKLTGGVDKERTINREKNQYDEVVRNSTTGKIIHQEHQRLSEHKKEGKNGRNILKKLEKRWLSAILTIVLGLIVCLIWLIISPQLPWEQPMSPSFISSPSPNPVVNTPSTQSVTITATPDFKPPYSNNIGITISNPNSYKCYMVLELEASAGFYFLPISDSLPPNVTVGEGYEYKDIMKVCINDFAPQFPLNLNLPVYTMNPDTFGGTEQITLKILAVQKEQ